jgi:hypothetical protein
MRDSARIEALIAKTAAGVSKALASHFPEALRLAGEAKAYEPLLPMLQAVESSPHLLDEIASHASFAELLYIVQQSTNADGDLDFDELDVALSLLSRTKYRWFQGRLAAGSGYERFERLNDAEMFAYMILHWQSDSSFLGGNFSAGAVQYPFTLLAAVAGVTTETTSYLNTWTDVVGLVSEAICKVDGVSAPESLWLSRVDQLARTHRNLVNLHIQKSHLEKTPAPSPAVKAAEQPRREPEANEELSREAALREASEQLASLIGVPTVKNEVKSLANFLKIRAQRMQANLPMPSQSLHFVFTGNPGTGKTTVARIISKVLFGFGVLKSAAFVEADRSSLVGGYVGQTAIKTSDVIDEAVNGVLFIDEAYALTQDHTGQDYGREAVDTLLKRMEDLRDRLVVIVAGYPDKMKAFVSSNPGLQSRFTRFIHFDDYSPPELCRILQKLCDESHYKLTEEARANAAILCHLAHAQRSGNFGNARFVRNFFEATLGNHANRLAVHAAPASKESLATIEAADLPYTVAEGVSGRFDVAASKWRMQCPSCKKARSVGLQLIGNRVACSCGAKFRCPWWNPLPESVPGVELHAPSEKPEDLLGWGWRPK